MVLFAFTMSAQANVFEQPPDLLDCDGSNPIFNPDGTVKDPRNLSVPSGYTQTYHAYASGFQIYGWTGTKYVLLGPLATLSVDPGFHGPAGHHFAAGADPDTGLGGNPNLPTWASNSGSYVVGDGIHKTQCTPAGHANSIPWLLIPASSSDGPGVGGGPGVGPNAFQGVGYIQRLNTSGGKAPSIFMGTPLSVDYTAEYFFYSPTE